VQKLCGLADAKIFAALSSHWIPLSEGHFLSYCMCIGRELASHKVTVILSIQAFITSLLYVCKTCIL
jgi:hypothetical protein